jgi:pimeloyl-ACP methyl ester carboxylesterase
LIAAGGNDSSLEEVVFWTGMAAVRRGYNFFTFEHPGHRGAVHLYPECVKRPDYEVPYRRALDVITSLPGVDERIAMTGYSFGGYVACRVATYEKRIRAVAPNPPIIDAYRLFKHDSEDSLVLKVLPIRWLNRIIERKMRALPLRYALAKYTMWSFGAPDLSWMEFASFEVQKPFVVGDCLRDLSIPALALAGAGEGDEMLRQTRAFYNTIASEHKRLYIFTIGKDHANDHCQLDNRARANQVMFDWLDGVFEYRYGLN